MLWPSSHKVSYSSVVEIVTGVRKVTGSTPAGGIRPEFLLRVACVTD